MTTGRASGSERLGALADVGPVVAAHLAVAVRCYRRDAAHQGLAVPAEVGWLETALAARAGGSAGVSGGQSGSALDRLAELLQSPRVTPQTLSYEDAAAFLRCSLSTVKRLISRGELHPVSVGGAKRLRVDDLNRYLDRREPSCRLPAPR